MCNPVVLDGLILSMSRKKALGKLSTCHSSLHRIRRMLAVPASHSKLGTMLGFLSTVVSSELCWQANASGPCCACPVSAPGPQNARHGPPPAAAPASASAALSASSKPSAERCSKPANGAAERCGDQCNTMLVFWQFVYAQCLEKPSDCPICSQPYTKA